MNNLTQIQHAALDGILDSQRRRVVDRYRNSDSEEQLAVIRQIDSLLPVLNGEQKIFWLKLRENLERLSDSQKSV
jgi:hypothetical protein